ncbi:MAG: hypothetical protein F6K40_37340 [Okeania sp. SIO3I5]|nr:hypothetical protein [Okeania sp. SIO3I5]NEQ41558.1 hypothetical protein [Okeania sp. SIO3I5]
MEESGVVGANGRLLRITIVNARTGVRRVSSSCDLTLYTNDATGHDINS